MSAALLLSCCLPAEGDPPPVSRLPLRVGSITYSEADLAARERIVRWKYPDAADARMYAASQLIQGALLEGVLERLGHPLTVRELDLEIARIDASTHDPKGLETLKALCGTDDAYRRIATLPDFANRRFYFEVYPQLEELHAERSSRVRDALRLLAGQGPNADFREVAAKDSTWQYSSLLFDGTRGFYRADDPLPQPIATDAPDAVRTALDDNTQWADYELELFANTPEKVVVDHVVQQPEGFLLLRWTGWEDRAAGVRRVEQLYLPKLPAAELFWEEAGNLEVEIGDAELQALLVKQISWMQRVKLAGDTGSGGAR